MGKFQLSQSSEHVLGSHLPKPVAQCMVVQIQNRLSPVANFGKYSRCLECKTVNLLSLV